MTDQIEAEELTGEESAALVERATQYGWKSPEDWKGDEPPNGFMTPEEYLARPHVQLRIRDDEFAELKASSEASLAEVRAASESMKRVYEESAERRREAHNAEVARIKADKERAVEDGDLQRYKQLDQQQSNLTPPQEQSAQNSEISAWAEKNKWFESDHYARGKAIEIAGVAARGGADAKAQVEAVDREMRRLMPHLFEAPKSETSDPKPSKVDGGGLAQLGGGKGFDSLPPDARAQAERDIAEGLYSSKEDWAKFYHGGQ